MSNTDKPESEDALLIDKQKDPPQVAPAPRRQDRRRLRRSRTKSRFDPPALNHNPPPLIDD
jgi:hypothetical protein